VRDRENYQLAFRLEGKNKKDIKTMTRDIYTIDDAKEAIQKIVDQEN
jgi:hypothetical protein